MLLYPTTQMADLTTYTRAKDWLIVALIGIVFTLLGVVATDNRRRIEIVEDHQEASQHVSENHSARLARMEEIINIQREEIGRRLGRIEDKVDRLSR